MASSHGPCVLSITRDVWPGARTAVIRCDWCSMRRRVFLNKDRDDIAGEVQLPCGDKILPGCAS